MLPQPRDFHPLPYPHFGEEEFQETLCGNLNNTIEILLSFNIQGTFPKDVLQFPYGNMHVHGVTNDPPNQNDFFII